MSSRGLNAYKKRMARFVASFLKITESYSLNNNTRTFVSPTTAEDASPKEKCISDVSPSFRE